MTQFSVVITTFNRAERVGQAINTVLGQTYEDLELIVVDDGSVDDTGNVVAAIDDPRLRYVYRDNGGLPAARNTGVTTASGRYVTFLDDDDKALPRWLESFDGALAGDDAVAICGANAVDRQGHITRTIVPKPLGPAYEGYRGLFLSGTFALPRRTYHEIGGFAEGVRYCPHGEFALRLLPYCSVMDFPVRVIDEPLLRWEMRGEGERPAASPENVLNGMEYVLGRHRGRLSRAPDLLADCNAMAGVASARLGHYRDARRFFVQAARAQPQRAKNWLRLGLACVPPLGDSVWRSRTYRDTKEGAALTG